MSTTNWKLFGRGAFGRPYFATVGLADELPASQARDYCAGVMERMTPMPSLIGMRLDIDGAPWMNVGQMRGKEPAVMVYGLTAPAIEARPDWLIDCPQDGINRPWGEPFEASVKPLPLHSTAYKAAERRFAVEYGRRCAVPIMVYRGITDGCPPADTQQPTKETGETS